MTIAVDLGRKATKQTKTKCREHISYIIKGRNPKFCVWMQLLMVERHIPFLGHFDLDLCR